MRALPLPGHRWLWIELGLVLAFGLFLRLLVLGSPAGTLNADEALTGLVGKYLLEGRVWLIVPGQHYSGTVEGLLSAPLYLLFGPNRVAMKALPIAIWLVCCLLVFLIARPYGTRLGLLLAALLWVFSGSMVLLSTLSYLGYGSGEVGSLAAIWLLCRELRSGQSADTSRQRQRERFWAGWLAGLALWQHPIQLTSLMPAFGYVAFERRRELPRWGWPNALGAIVGLAPWLLYTAVSGGETLVYRSTVETTYLERFQSYLADLLPRTLGFRALTGEWIGGILGQIASAGFLLTALFACLTLILRSDKPGRMIGIIGIACPFILAGFNGAFFTIDARYGLLFAPFIVLAIGLSLQPWLERALRYPLALAGMTVAWAAMLALPSLDYLDILEPAPPPESDIQAVIDVLDQNGVHEAISDYWLSYRISYRTGERIYVAPGVGAIRLPRDQEMVHEGGPWNTLIFFSGSEAERASSAIKGRDPIIVPVLAPTDPYHWQYAAVSIYLPTPPEAQASAGQSAAAELAGQ